MKILQVISQLGNGGAEKFIVELSNELSREHEVILVSFRAVQDWMYHPKRLKGKVKLITLNKKDGFSLKVYYQLIKLFRQEKPDIVHLHLYSTLLYLFPLKFLFFNLQFVYTIHSNLHDLNKKRMKNKLSKPLYYKNGNFSYVCISSDIQKEFTQYFPQANFYHIDNGISYLHTSPLINNVREELNKYKQEGSQLFVLIGSISKVKNYTLLLDVFELLKEKSITAIVIGDVERANKQVVTPLMNRKLDNVHFIGARENVADYLACADAFMMTSNFEGMPIAALEAMSMALPIVATPAGGLKDLVHEGKGGFLSACVGDKDALADAMCRFLSLSKQERAQMGEYNKMYFMQNYSIENASNKYLNLFKELTNLS